MTVGGDDHRVAIAEKIITFLMDKKSITKPAVRSRIEGQPFQVALHTGPES